MAKQNNLCKGFKQEEFLRRYFLKTGYFAVRGVPYIYETHNITDVDVWLYGKTSHMAREILIVDSKNKKTPQAIERIFWVQGLKLAIKANGAIVATTDKRPEVREFGKKIGVTVIDGFFLSKIEEMEEQNNRLDEEEFSKLISDYALSKLDGDWSGQILRAKSLLVNGLTFDSCNEWLQIGNFFAQQAVVRPGQREIALRCMYLICSFLSIAIDYLQRDLFYLDGKIRTKKMTDGFSYGSKGMAGFQKLINISLGLVNDFVHNGQNIATQMRYNLQKRLDQSPEEDLGAFFSRTEIVNSLFNIGRELESLAMKREFCNHELASFETKSVIFCLLDYWGITRSELSK